MTLEEHDYDICPYMPDGRHVPRAGYDPEQSEGYATVECSACGQTTGIPIPPTEEITW